MGSPSEKKTNLLFPVETINRELDFRLFLAAKCATANNRIFIGQHDLLYRLSKYAPGGVYIGKNLFLLEFPLATLERYQTIKQRGITFIHLDDEGAIYVGGPDDWRRALDARLDPTVLAADDYVCTWGDFQRDYFRSKNPRCAPNIRTTGHPRFDLCTPRYRSYFDDEVEGIRRRFGRFVLLNTNLTYGNNALGLVDTFSLRNGWDPDSAPRRKRFMDAYVHTVKILLGFVSVMHTLSVELPHLNFVLRPHPLEDRSYYEHIFRAIKNVHVLHEGGVNPWLLACQAMIHDGCTTGVEGQLAGTPLVNYKSVELFEHDLFLPNIFGIQTRTEAETVDAVRAITSGGLPAAPEVRDADALSLLANLERTSFEPFLEVLAEAEASRSVTRSAFDERAFLRADAARRAADVGRAVARRFSPARAKWHAALRLAFYGFDKADLARRIAKVERVVGKRLSWRFYGPELFTVEDA